jgi:hypothetical protein
MVALRRSDDMRTLFKPAAFLAAFTFSVTVASAQMPPPLAPPMVPNPNPSASFTVPQAPEVPVSPTLPSSGPGATAVGGGLMGTNEVVNPPHSVLAPPAGKRHRNRHYAHHPYPQ